MIHSDPSLDALFAPACRAFVAANRDADVTRLLLGRAPPGIDLRLVAEQLTARRKAREKLPVWFATPDLVFPPPVSVEQASSQLTADYKAALVRIGRITWLFPDCSWYGRRGQGRSTSVTFKRSIESGLTS